MARHACGCPSAEINVVVCGAATNARLPVQILPHTARRAVDRTPDARQAVGIARVAPTQRKLAVIACNVGAARQIARRPRQRKAVRNKRLKAHLHSGDTCRVGAGNLGAVPCAQRDALREAHSDHGAWQPWSHCHSPHKGLGSRRRGDRLPLEGGAASHLERESEEELARAARALAETAWLALVTIGALDASGRERAVA